MKPFILFLSLTCSGFLSQAQSRYVNWFFAFGSGVKFNDSGPSIVSGGKTASEEGVATMSDPCGNLLFYSDGTAIWNKKHNLMVNGNGLMGNIQSAEAVLIVPMPLSDSLYYVFTTDSYGSGNGVQYSIVDMSKQSGDGEVITKNIKLYAKSSEKLTAVLHANKRDYWILTHDWNNEEYKVYLLTDVGLNTTPVVTVLGPGTNSSVENALGHLRPSPDGKLVACSFWEQNILDIYNFNNSNGGLTLKTTLTNFDHNRPYSIEFSPDNKILYVGEAATSSDNDIYQFDLTATNIAGSRYTVTTANYRFGNFGLGPDGKFYIAKFNQNSLGVITNPNTFGSGVNYVTNGFDLGSQKGMLGLPNAIFPFLLQNPEYALSVIPGCKLSDPVKVELLSNYCYDSLVWDFSDFSSGNNYSRKKKDSHIYPYKGNYDIILTVYYKGKAYKMNQNVMVPATPIVNLGRDTFFCGNFSYFLDADNYGATFLWHDNYAGRLRNATQPGKYYVKVTSGNCSASDTIIIKGASGTALGRDTILCFNNTFLYDLPSADSIIWKDGAKGKTRNFTSPGGVYPADVWANGCKITDSISILLPNLAQNPLPPDTTLCEGAMVNISLNSPGVSYLWSDGGNGGGRAITKPGFYKLVQTASKCNASDSFNVAVIPKIKFRTFNDTSICIGDTMIVNPKFQSAVLKLNNITVQKVPIKLFTAGQYYLEASNVCFRDSALFNLTLDSCKTLEFIFPEIFSPNGDILNDEYKPVLIGDPNKILRYDFKVYNRWGEMIFKSDKYSFGWKGDYFGNPCQLGNYLWICHLKFMNKGEPVAQEQKGLIMLIR